MATASQSRRSLLEDYYALMDSGRLHEAAGMFVDDVKLTFGNAEPVYGPEAAEAAIQYVIDLTDSIEHKVVNFWEVEAGDATSTVIFELRITYNLKDARTLVNPGMGLGVLNAEGRFVEQRLYGGINLAEL